MPKKIDIEELARMIQEDVVTKMASKSDLQDLRSEMIERLDRIDKRLDQIERRLDHIEEVVLKDHLQRIQSIEHAIGLRKIVA